MNIIADFRLPIADLNCRVLCLSPIGNRQSAIGNDIIRT